MCRSRTAQPSINSNWLVVCVFTMYLFIIIYNFIRLTGIYNKARVSCFLAWNLKTLIFSCIFCTLFFLLIMWIINTSTVLKLFLNVNHSFTLNMSYMMPKVLKITPKYIHIKQEHHSVYKKNDTYRFCFTERVSEAFWEMISTMYTHYTSFAITVASLCTSLHWL